MAGKSGGRLKLEPSRSGDHRRVIVVQLCLRRGLEELTYGVRVVLRVCYSENEIRVRGVMCVVVNLM